MYKWHETLRGRLMILVFMSLVPAAGLILHNASTAHNALLANQRADTARQLSLISQEQTRLIEGTAHLLVALSRVPAVRGADADACRRFLADLVGQYYWYHLFGVATPGGEVVCDSYESRTIPSIADRSYFQRAISTRRFSVGDYQIGRTSGIPSFSLSYPVLDARGEVAAVIFTSIRMYEFARLGSDVPLAANAVLVTADPSGTVLSRAPERPSIVGTKLPPGLLKFSSAKGSGSAETAGADGVMRMYAYTTSANGLFMALGVARADLLTATRRELAVNLLGLAIIIILSTGIAWAASDALVLKHLRQLLHATRRLAAGELEARSGVMGAPTEMKQLASAFDDMAQSIQLAQNELHTANTKLESLSRGLLETHELERTAVATELHEEVCQSLAAIMMNLHASQKTSGAARVSDSMHIADSTLQRVRVLSATLCPPQLNELGLEAAIRSFAEHQTARTGVDIEVSGSIGGRRLPALLEVTCFRAMEKAVLGAIHQNAAKVWVDLADEDAAVLLTVSDDAVEATRGGELDLAPVRATTLAEVSQRVRLAGGHMEIVSSAKLGTEVRARLPLRGNTDLAAPREGSPTGRGAGAQRGDRPRGA
jgi:signal transduction histidine kinase